MTEHVPARQVVAPVGSVGRPAGRIPKRPWWPDPGSTSMADDEDDRCPDDGDRRDDLRRRHTEEEPVVGLEGLHGEADDAVPDEEHEEQIPGSESVGEPPGDPDQGDRTDEPGERFVQGISAPSRRPRSGGGALRA